MFVQLYSLIDYIVLTVYLRTTYLTLFGQDLGGELRRRCLGTLKSLEVTFCYKVGDSGMPLCPWGFSLFSLLPSHKNKGFQNLRLGWRDGSVVTSTGCSSRGPGFSSQQPHGSSQPPVTPVPRDLMPSSGLCRYCTHVCR